MDVTAAILAGGLGTRLRSAVPDRPKVLAEVCGRPFITYLLDRLVEASFLEVVLLTGYRGRQVQETLGETYQGMRLLYSEEPQPLGTAGALRLGLPQLKGRQVLLLNGDSYCEVDLPAFWKWHELIESSASMVLVRVPDVSRFGHVDCDSAGRLVGFREKQAANGAGWINAGVYLLERALVEQLPMGPLSLERDLLPQWVARRLVWGMKCRGRFLDIGTPESYVEAESFLLETRRPSEEIAGIRHRSATARTVTSPRRSASGG
jgi:NDP-sugar pyrophosphorylase family protein